MHQVMRIDKGSKAIIELLFIFILVVCVVRYSNENASTDELMDSADVEDGHALLRGQRLDANTATIEDFVLLPGIGQVKARALYEKREEICGFTSIEDLVMVKGIGLRTSKKLEKWLRFDSQLPMENHKR